MKGLNAQEKEQVKQAVKTAEKKTSGEFVTIIARQSDTYFYVPAMWAGLIALVLPLPLIFLFSFSNAKIIMDIQFVTFVVLYIIFQIDAIQIRLVPREVKYNRARKLAMEQFVIRGISGTKNRAGVLFFVSLSERFVEIIADKGINDKVDKEAWQKIVDEFIDNVRQNRMCAGFTTAIEKCGNILSTHFPLESGDKNELTDNLIEL